jgi:hypothetical protein
VLFRLHQFQLRECDPLVSVIVIYQTQVYGSLPPRRATLEYRSHPRRTLKEMPTLRCN